MFRAGSKRQRVYEALVRGCTLDEAMAICGWSPAVTLGEFAQIADRSGDSVTLRDGVYRFCGADEAAVYPMRPPRAEALVGGLDRAALAAWIEAEWLRNGYAWAARGWAYVAEGHGLITKESFDKFGNVLAELRKCGLLDPDAVKDDSTRGTAGIGYVDDDDPVAYASDSMRQAAEWLASYCPIDFFDALPTYVEVLVEKVDLVTMFGGVCSRYNVPLTNGKGNSDVNLRRRMLQRFKAHHEAGRQCVLLYFGDHDPPGLRIADTLAKNLCDCGGIRDVAWAGDDILAAVSVERIGLTVQIDDLGLPWVDNLETASGRSLADPKHPDHGKPYVQNYLAAYGPRKVEANALARNPRAAQELLRASIERFVTVADLADYKASLEPHRAAARAAFKDVVSDWHASDRDEDADD